MKIDYNHKKNTHILASSKKAFQSIFSEIPQSLLDVGCGTGTWMRAASDVGVADVFGVDGVEVPESDLHVSPRLIKTLDLTLPWDLSKTYDVILCLEVAEHIEEGFSETLIKSLVKHADIIYFSAACPGQTGQHHVNCQWPEYWQKIFNKFGYVCEDSIRWKIWDDSSIEPWYRQNLFIAKKNEHDAGNEIRIKSVIHPEIFEICMRQANNATNYFRNPFNSLKASAKETLAKIISAS